VSLADNAERVIGTAAATEQGRLPSAGDRRTRGQDGPVSLADNAGRVIGTAAATEQGRLPSAAVPARGRISR
jgi:hypothetical protein